MLEKNINFALKTLQTISKKLDGFWDCFNKSLIFHEKTCYHKNEQNLLREVLYAFATVPKLLLSVFVGLGIEI